MGKEASFEVSLIRNATWNILGVSWDLYWGKGI